MTSLSSSFQLGAAALILALSALLSRLMGLVRDKIISWQFGASHEADMYFAAFVVPDIINYLLAGGFMSITLIPIMSRIFKKNNTEAWRFFSCVVFYMFAGSCLLTAIGEIWAKPLASLIAPGFTAEQLERLVLFMRIILPGQIFFLTGASFTALLFLRRQFAVPALSPLVYNGCIIIFGLSMPFLAGSDIGMTGYCIGVSVGAFFGALLLPFAIAARDSGIQFIPTFWHPEMKKFFILALPLMLGQTVIMLDEQFLRVFGSMLGEGAVSLLNYGRRIAQVPVSLMGQAIAVASYPFLVKLLAENDHERFDATLNGALKAGLALIIPLAMGMMAAASPILGIIFQGGRFGQQETIACTPLAQLMLAATPAWIIYMVLSRAFYAHEDSITPAVTGTIITICVIPCYYFFAVPQGAWAIAALSGTSIAIYVCWISAIWKKRHGSGAFHSLIKLAGRAFICSVFPSLAAWSICAYLPNFWPDLPFFDYCAKLVMAMIAFASLFLPAAFFILPEAMQTIRKRLARVKSQSGKNA